MKIETIYTIILDENEKETLNEIKKWIEEWNYDFPDAPTDELPEIKDVIILKQKELDLLWKSLMFHKEYYIQNEKKEPEIAYDIRRSIQKHAEAWA
jgi:hypothetical protein